MADEKSTEKKVTLSVFSHAMQTLASTIKGVLMDAAGLIKATLIPLGSGLKIADGKIAVDTSSLTIDPTEVGIEGKTALPGEGVTYQPGDLAGVGYVDAKVADELSKVDHTIAKVVDALPEAPEAADVNKLHLVAVADAPEGNTYAEYLYSGGKWEKVGEYKADIDLTPYAKTADLEAYVKTSDLPAEATEAEIDAAVESAFGAVFGTAAE